MNSVDIEKRAIRECGKPKYTRKYIDRARIIRLWEEYFWTQQAIADICKCSIPTVRRVLRQEGYEQIYSGSWGTVKVMRHKRVTN